MPTPSCCPQSDPTLPRQGHSDTHCEDNPGPSPGPPSTVLSLPEHVGLCQLCSLPSCQHQTPPVGSRAAIATTRKHSHPRNSGGDEGWGLWEAWGSCWGRNCCLAISFQFPLEQQKFSPLREQLLTSPVPWLSTFAPLLDRPSVSPHDVPKVVTSPHCPTQGHQVAFCSL